MTHIPVLRAKVLALEGEHKSYPALFILDQQPQHCRLTGMKLAFRKLFVALAFGFGAMAALPHS
jgi:hypothetical protein